MIERYFRKHKIDFWMLSNTITYVGTISKLFFIENGKGWWVGQHMNKWYLWKAKDSCMSIPTCFNTREELIAYILILD